MDNEKYVAKEVDSVSEDSNSPASEQIAQSRRRLFRQGASVVAVTLASKPVLAWHCRTPSMWGSMAMNPATSLMKNENHLSGVVDESWYIANWKDNSERQDVPLAQKKPWDALFHGKPWPANTAVFLTSAPSNGSYVIVSNGSSIRYVKIDSYQVSDFCIDAGISCNASGTVKSLFSNQSTFNAHIVVAQLHEKLLPGVRECVDTELNLASIALANGVATINGVNWTPEMFIDYFEANWIAVANFTSQKKWSYGTFVDNSVNSSIRQSIYENPSSQDRHYFTFK